MPRPIRFVFSFGAALAVVLASLFVACGGARNDRRTRVSAPPPGVVVDASQERRDGVALPLEGSGATSVPPAGDGNTMGSTTGSGSTTSGSTGSGSTASGGTGSEGTGSGSSAGGGSSSGGSNTVPPPTGGSYPRGPTGRSLGALSPSECMAQLRSLGISHRVENGDRAREAIDAPVEPTGPIGGVTVTFAGRSATNRVMDCRLVLAIYAWSPALRAAGVTAIRHLSAFRPGAVVRTTGRPSGHARGLAFDPRYFTFRGDDAPFDILDDWQPRTRGAPPCEGPNGGESPRSRTIRRLTCDAIAAELFQVVVTPHHNDAHANHLHLEVVPGADWSWSA